MTSELLEPEKVKAPPGDELRHSFFASRPDRTLCGQPRNPAQRSLPYDGPHANSCVVCAALAESWLRAQRRALGLS